MPTPDPIALPELPEPEVTERVYGMGRHDFDDVPLHFTADQMRAYGQACVDALTPAPQVPEGMVLVPREPTPELVEVICDRHAGKSVWPDDYGHPARAIRRHQAREGYRAMLAVAALNQPFGKPEELPLNEPSGNSGQLASLEQRALSDEFIDAALFDSMDEESAMLIDYMGMGHSDKLELARAVLRSAITAALANQQEGDINPSGPSFQAGYDTGHSEFQWLAGLVNNPVCERCGATSDLDAETKCRPTDCSCPGSEFPLAQLWALQRPKASQQGVGGG